MTQLPWAPSSSSKNLHSNVRNDREESITHNHPPPPSIKFPFDGSAAHLQGAVVPVLVGRRWREGEGGGRGRGGVRPLPRRVGESRLAEFHARVAAPPVPRRLSESAAIARPYLDTAAPPRHAAGLQAVDHRQKQRQGVREPAHFLLSFLYFLPLSSSFLLFRQHTVLDSTSTSSRGWRQPQPLGGLVRVSCSLVETPHRRITREILRKRKKKGDD